LKVIRSISLRLTVGMNSERYGIMLSPDRKFDTGCRNPETEDIA